MLVAYSVKENKIVTEEEMINMVNELIEDEGFLYDYICELPPSEIWEMLTDSYKDSIQEVVYNQIIEDDFIIREF